VLERKYLLGHFGEALPDEDGNCSFLNLRLGLMIARSGQSPSSIRYIYYNANGATNISPSDQLYRCNQVPRPRKSTRRFIHFRVSMYVLGSATNPFLSRLSVLMSDAGTNTCLNLVPTVVIALAYQPH
jgi:hypothetical protein